MAFKSIKAYNEERFGGMFTLRNDGDYADVIFMYEKDDDVLVADTHYIKSADYSGYVHCCGRGCPACTKGLRVQNKLFIPLYNLTTNKIEFWDRTIRFEPQLHQEVFAKYPNPSEVVFRITRKGAAGDIHTTYSILAINRNNVMSFGEICAKNGITFPDYYSNVCKEVGATELSGLLTNSLNSAEGSSASTLPEYQATPRVSIPNAVANTSSLDSIPTLTSDSDTSSSDFEDVEDEEVPF